MRSSVDQSNNFAASYNGQFLSTIPRPQQELPHNQQQGTQNLLFQVPSICSSSSSLNGPKSVVRRNMKTLGSFNKKVNPDLQHEQLVLDEHHHNEPRRRIHQRNDTVHFIPMEDEKDVKESTIPQQTRQLDWNNHIPILNMTKSIVSDSSSSFGRNTKSAFEEQGTSTFSTSPIVLSLLELDEAEHNAGSISVINKITEEYSSKICAASLLFNNGAHDVWNCNYFSARTHFNQALALFLDIDYNTIDFIPNFGIRKQVFTTIALLTSITLLNRGHIEWYLNNIDESINFYHQCYACLNKLHLIHTYTTKGSSSSKQTIEETLFFIKYVTASCLHCIGTVILNTKLFNSSLEGSSKTQIRNEGDVCLKYLESALAMFEDLESGENIGSTSITAHTATVMSNIGRVYLIFGDLEKALYYSEGCLGRRLLT